MEVGGVRSASVWHCCLKLDCGGRPLLAMASSSIEPLIAGLEKLLSCRTPYGQSLGGGSRMPLSCFNFFSIGQFFRHPSSFQAGFTGWGRKPSFQGNEGVGSYSRGSEEEHKGEPFLSS